MSLRAACLEESTICRFSFSSVRNVNGTFCAEAVEAAERSFWLSPGAAAEVALFETTVCGVSVAGVCCSGGCGFGRKNIQTNRIKKNPMSGRRSIINEGSPLSWLSGDQNRLDIAAGSAKGESKLAQCRAKN